MQIIIAALAAVFVISGTAQAAPLISIVGDSTVESRPLSQDRAGWGQMLPEFFDDEAALVNHAVGGRSSKSFLLEGRWQPVLDETPSYVLIQFGHNDLASKGVDRATLPGAVPSPLPGDQEVLGHRIEDWYRANLTRYVNEARAIGAIPILVSPMERLRFDDGGNIKRTNEPYALATAVVADELDVTLIDLHAFSIQLYESLGDQAEAYHYVDPEHGGIDRTHFNREGARLYAAEVARVLREEEPGLREVIIPEPTSALLIGGTGLSLLSRRR